VGDFRILGKRPRLAALTGQHPSPRPKNYAHLSQSANFHARSPFPNFSYPIFLAETWFAMAETGSIFLPFVAKQAITLNADGGRRFFAAKRLFGPIFLF
jgi:hypothetical protein